MKKALCNGIRKGIKKKQLLPRVYLHPQIMMGCGIALGFEVIQAFQ